MDNTNIKDNAVNAESPNIGKKINKFVIFLI